MERAPNNYRLFVVGPENVQNMKLAQTLREIVGSKQVSRYLELSEMVAHCAESNEQPVTIFLDLLGYDLTEVTNTIGRIRKGFPVCVFVLYLDKDEYARREHELSREWITRLKHFFRIYKMADDAAFEPIVRRAIQVSIQEADDNLIQRRSTNFAEGIAKAPSAPTASANRLTFISYSRDDWQDFVEGFVQKLQADGLDLWIDQHLLVGGDDWMDSIGEALDTCKALTLIMSPYALASRFVKMEYRYFLNNDKPVIPILYRPLEKIPFELATIQYFDFSKGQSEKSYAQYLSVLKKNLV